MDLTVRLSTASGAFDPTDSPFLDTEMCTPHVLVPTIRITPEIDVIGDGETSIWVAVEVAASLRRPDGVDPMGKRTARDGSGVQLGMMHSALSEFENHSSTRSLTTVNLRGRSRLLRLFVRSLYQGSSRRWHDGVGRYPRRAVPYVGYLNGSHLVLED